MCSGAIMNARIPHLIYGAANPLYGGIDSCFHIGEGIANHTLDITSGILKEKCQTLMDDFFIHRRKSSHHGAVSKWS